MKKALQLLIVIFLVSCCISCRKGEHQEESIQKGPFTATILNDGIYVIRHGTDSNPCGFQYDANGNMIGLNNCSDMYMVLAKKNAILIDLSHPQEFIDWDSTAIESIRSIVHEIKGKRKLLITCTHNHPDHIGLIPAFYNDEKASFWINKAEFSGMDIFPQDRTTWFTEGDTLDLGSDIILNTIEVPGHTDHGTLFFMKDKNIVFSGDAIGSGSGVWIYSYDNFMKYIDGIEKLIGYIDNPANNIDTGKLIIYSGHGWQVGDLGQLTSQYIYDMRTLIEKLGQGNVEYEPMSSDVRPTLNANFRYGTATITWNTESAEQYAESLQGE